MAAPPRSTFAGNPSIIADALLPFADRQEWIRLAANVERRHAKQKRVMKSAPIVRALRDIQDNLSFTKSKMDKAMRQLREKVKFEFDPDCEADATLDSWSKILRANCRFVQQAKTKNPSCLWVQSIFNAGAIPLFKFSKSANKRIGQKQKDRAGPAVDLKKSCSSLHEDADDRRFCSDSPAFALEVAEAPAESAAAASSSAAASQPGKSYFEDIMVTHLFGWSYENKCAWRSFVSKGRPQAKEFSCDIRIEHDDLPIIAKWHDGMEQPIPEILGNFFKAKYDKRAELEPSKDLEPSKQIEQAPQAPLKRPAADDSAEWCQVMDDGTEVKLQKKDCRYPLWQLKINGSAKCQARRDLPGTLDVMKNLLVLFCDRQVSVKDLHSKRNELLAGIEGAKGYAPKETIMPGAPKLKPQVESEPKRMAKRPAANTKKKEEKPPDEVHQNTSMEEAADHDELPDDGLQQTTSMEVADREHVHLSSSSPPPMLPNLFL